MRTADPGMAGKSDSRPSDAALPGTVAIGETVRVGLHEQQRGARIDGPVVIEVGSVDLLQAAIAAG